MYSGGAAERRLRELARDKAVLIATKFPGALFFRTENLPKELEASLARLGRSSVDLYQHHFPSKQMRVAQAALARRGVPLASNQVEYSL
jgi:aryl-alcohol dehydrogenase-like predicted oxidoreductase